MSDPALRLADATIGYGDVAIVRDADLTVRRGEAVAVLGSNGPGKTTLSPRLPGPAPGLRGSAEGLRPPGRRPAERGRLRERPQRDTLSGPLAAPQCRGPRRRRLPP